MALPRSIIKYRDLFLKAGLVDEMTMKSALGRVEQWGGRLGHILVESQFAKEAAVMKVISEAFRMPVNDLSGVQKDPVALSKLDASACEEKGVFPISLKNRVLTLAVADPSEIAIADELGTKIGVRVQIMLASESQIKAAINTHYRGVRATVADDHDSIEMSDANPSAPDAGSGFIPTSQRNEATFDIDGSAPPPKPKPPPPPPPMQSFMARPPSANTLLDEMFDESARPADFTRDELVRLEAARANQDKTSTIVRVLQELLTEKGYLSRS